VSKTNINEDIIESLIGKTAEKKRSKIPARLDVLQSATGLFLAIFMVFHMLFVSTILVSKDFMLSVTKAFELSFIVDGGSCSCFHCYLCGLCCFYLSCFFSIEKISHQLPTVFTTKNPLCFDAT